MQAPEHPLCNTHHRQDWLLAIECLDLTFFIEAENKGSVRPRHVKAHDIAHFVDEQRITRQLDGLAPMRLQTERHPHSADCGVGKAVSSAIERIDQCVASEGVVRKVRSITAAT